jgi:hypothetical protein
MRPSPRTRKGTQPLDAPDSETPSAPGTNGEPSDIELPDVPPLEGTSSGGADSNFESIYRGGEAALAAGTFADDSPGATPAVATEAIRAEAVRDVWLHGEVVENDSGGGPRLVVYVEPRDAHGNTTAFDGSLSLMLLVPGDGRRESLARWDFTPEDVESARASADDSTISFHLELAANATIPQSSQIWVRLLPRGSDKVLAFADIDLLEPGSFSSFPQEPAQNETVPIDRDRRGQSIAVDSESEEPLSPSHYAVHTRLNDAGWSTARPGEPATLDLEAETGAEWRASSEPMPVAVAHSTPVPTQRLLSRPASRSTRPKVQPVRPRTSIAWSPDRSREAATAGSTAARPDRPRWSATR